jgi:hypothetical protein
MTGRARQPALLLIQLRGHAVGADCLLRTTGIGHWEPRDAWAANACASTKAGLAPRDQSDPVFANLESVAASPIALRLRIGRELCFGMNSGATPTATPRPWGCLPIL